MVKRRIGLVAAVARLLGTLSMYRGAIDVV